ncbi:MAB_1171c family putative transporter [Streptomyces sp. NPDC059564]|uniref:MAB_1171c family putative transporter n=1 Tax=Streptomyces sp. NPDC059564 TaxID=3346865 RepID=UPI0036A2A21A
MSDLAFFVPAVLGTVAVLVRLPRLRRNVRDPLLRAVVMYLLTCTGVFYFGATSTIVKVNEVTGVPNFAAPLLYSLLMACCGSGIILMITWRGGPPARIRRATRWCAGTYGALAVAMFVLFALGEAPVERLEDLDTYYANTPYIREMILLYLMGHSAAAVIMASLCRRWLSGVPRELRAGLGLMIAGYTITLGFDVCKFAAVGARWAGVDWDVLSTKTARPFVTVSFCFILLGFGVPLIVQRFKEPWRDWTRYRRLETLSRLLHGLTPTTAVVKIPLLSTMGVRRLHRESGIHDGLLTLNPYFDLALRARALADALAHGAADENAAAAADAVMVIAAVDALRADPERRVIASSRELQPEPGEKRDLVRISHALARILLSGDQGRSIPEREHA